MLKLTLKKNKFSQFKFTALVLAFWARNNNIFAGGGVKKGGGGVKTGVMDLSRLDPLQGADVMTVLNNIVDFLLRLASPLAVIMVLWAGFLFLTAGGSTERLTRAKATLQWAVIGIVVLLIAKGVVSIIKSFLTG